MEIRLHRRKPRSSESEDERERLVEGTQVPPSTSVVRGGRWNASPRTILVGGWWRQLDHLLSDDAHLLAIGRVGRHATDLLADRRAD